MGFGSTDVDLRSDSSSSTTYDIKFRRQYTRPIKQKQPPNPKSNATIPDYLVWRCTDCSEDMSVFYKAEHLGGKSHAKVLHTRGMSRDSAIGEDHEDLSTGDAASRRGFEEEGSGEGALEEEDCYEEDGFEEDGFEDEDEDEDEDEAGSEICGANKDGNLIDILPFDQTEIDKAPQHHFDKAEAAVQSPASEPYVLNQKIGPIIHTNQIATAVSPPSLSEPLDLETFHCGTCSTEIPLADISKHLSRAPQWQCYFCHHWLHRDWRDKHLEYCKAAPSDAGSSHMNLNTTSLVADQCTKSAHNDLLCDDIAPITLEGWGVLTDGNSTAPYQVDSELLLLDEDYSPGSGSGSLTSGNYMSALEELILPMYESQDYPASEAQTDNSEQPEAPTTTLPDPIMEIFTAQQLDEIFGGVQPYHSDEKAESIPETEAELVPETEAELIPGITPEREMFQCLICSKNVPVEDQRYHTGRAYECTTCKITMHDGYHKMCHFLGKRHKERVSADLESQKELPSPDGEEETQDEVSLGSESKNGEPESQEMLSPPVKTLDSESTDEGEHASVAQETPTPQENKNHVPENNQGSEHQDLGQGSSEIPTVVETTAEKDTFHCLVCSKDFPIEMQKHHRDRAWSCYVCLETIHWSEKDAHLGCEEHEHRRMEGLFEYISSPGDIVTPDNEDESGEVPNSHGQPISRKTSISTNSPNSNKPPLLQRLAEIWNQDTLPSGSEQAAAPAETPIREAFELPPRPPSENPGDAWECKLCNRRMQVSSRDPHLLGTKHREQIRLHRQVELRKREEALRQAQTVPASIGWECQLCGRRMQISSKEAHLAGFSHREKERLRAAEELKNRGLSNKHPANGDWECRTCDRRMQVTSIPEHTRGLRHREQEELRQKGVALSEGLDDWKCSICWKGIQWHTKDAHLASSEHRELERLLNLTSTPHLDTGALVYESIWECRICQRAMPHSFVNAHLTDPYHKQEQQKHKGFQMTVQAEASTAYRSQPVAAPTTAIPETFYCEICRGTFHMKYKKMHEGGEWRCLVCGVFTHETKRKEHEAGRKHRQLSLQQQ